NQQGSGTIASATAAVRTATGAFTTPLNSVPNQDGTKLYFVADGPNGPGVFSVASMGTAEAAALAVGAPFETPIDIAESTDGNTLYVVDIGAEDDSNIMSIKKGRIFSVASAGGTPSAIAAADGTSPRGLALVKDAGGGDVIYFTGVDMTNAAAV